MFCLKAFNRITIKQQFNILTVSLPHEFVTKWIFIHMFNFHIFHIVYTYTCIMHATPCGNIY